MAANRRDLYLAVSGNVTGLSAAMKTGRSLVLEFGNSSINVLDAVEAKFAEVGKGSAGGLKEVERAYGQTFDRIRRNADAVLKAPSPQAAVQIVDAQQSLASAEAAERKAQAYRLVAEAANRADQAQGGQNQAVRAYAVAAAQAAVLADQESQAFREQADVLGLVDGQLERHGTAQRRSVTLSGQAKAGYQQLSYQLGDVATQYASGTSATIIFAQQSGQVLQAISLITGEAKGLLGLLGGPWGIAFSSALVLLTPWVGKILEGNDALEKESDELRKNADKAATTAQAKEAFARTEAGVAETVRGLTEDIKRQNDALRTNAELANVNAKKALEQATLNRGSALRELTAAQDELARTPRTGNGAEPGAVSQLYRNAETKVDEAERKLATATSGLRDATVAYQQSRVALAAEQAATAVDPIARTKKFYDDQIADYRRQQDAAARAGKVIDATTERHIEGLIRQRNEAVKTAEAEQQLKNAAGRSSGNTTTLAFPVEGGRITSGVGARSRPTAGASTHHAGLDIAVPIGTSVRAGAAGVVISAGRLGGYGNAVVVDYGGGTIAKYGHLSALLTKAGDRVSAGEQIGLSGSSGVSTGPHLHYEVRTNGKVVDPRRSVRVGNQDAAAARDATQEQRAEEAAAKAIAEIHPELGDAVDPAVIKARAEKISREFLANFQAIFGDEDPLAAFIAQGNDDIRRTGELYEQIAEEQASRPLARFKAQLHDDTDDMNLALEGVGVHAFDNLEGGLLRVLDGTGTLSDAFHSMTNGIIADLARIAIEKAILKGLDSVLAGAGKFLGFSRGGEVQAHADGGLIAGPGSGTSDDILSWLSNGEFVVRADATRRHLPLLRAINDNKLPGFATGGLVGVPQLPSVTAAQRALAGGRQQVELVGDIKVSPTKEFDARMEGVAYRAIGSAAEPIMAGAEARTLKRLRRPSLPGAPG